MHLLEGPNQGHSLIYLDEKVRKERREEEKAHSPEGIEPLTSWSEASVLPLSYHRAPCCSSWLGNKIKTTNSNAPVRFIQGLDKSAVGESRRVDSVDGDDDVTDAQNVAPLSPRSGHQIRYPRLRPRRTGRTGIFLNGPTQLLLVYLVASLTIINGQRKWLVGTSCWLPQHQGPVL